MEDRESPLFCMRARLTLDDDDLVEEAARSLPSCGATSGETKQLLGAYARSYVKNGGAAALAHMELRQILACREALLHFRQAVQREFERSVHELWRVGIGPEGDPREVPKATAVHSLAWLWKAGLAASVAASIGVSVWLVIAGQSTREVSDSGPTPARPADSLERPAVEIIRVGMFDLTLEHGHGMFSGIQWRGAQEPALRASPLYEYYNAGWGGLFALHQDSPPFREAAQAQTRLADMQHSGRRLRLVYENPQYGRKIITAEGTDQFLRMECDLGQCRTSVWTSQCGQPLFFRRVYILTAGRERNFNLSYAGTHTNFIYAEDNSELHDEVLLTNETGSFAWLSAVSPVARPLLLSTGSGLNGPNWRLEPGDKLTVYVGSEATLRSLRTR